MLEELLLSTRQSSQEASHFRQQVQPACNNINIFKIPLNAFDSRHQRSLERWQLAFYFNTHLPTAWPIEGRRGDMIKYTTWTGLPVSTLCYALSLILVHKRRVVSQRAQNYSTNWDQETVLLHRMRLILSVLGLWSLWCFRRTETQMHICSDGTQWW